MSGRRTPPAAPKVRDGVKAPPVTAKEKRAVSTATKARRRSTSTPAVDLGDPSARLAAAVADLQQFRDQWEDFGRPAMTLGSNGQLAPHPMVRLIRDAERAVQLLSQAPGAVVAPGARGGRPRGSSSAPDRLRPVLRAVK